MGIKVEFTADSMSEDIIQDCHRKAVFRKQTLRGAAAATTVVMWQGNIDGSGINYLIYKYDIKEVSLQHLTRQKGSSYDLWIRSSGTNISQ